MKDLEFLGSSQKDIAKFPGSAKSVAGFQLHRVQVGLAPSDWKPMGSVGVGVREIRINVQAQFRVIYVAKYQGKVYVLHAFEKKTQKTEKRDIELAKVRLKGIDNDHN
jgi:phage-related protein